jgi:hypothetical protein
VRLPARARWYVVIAIAGAALAAPAPFLLELRSEGRIVEVPLRGDAIVYSYRQSIYGVVVHEQLRAEGTGLRTVRAVSTDRRALEYYRWPGDATEQDGTLTWNAPDAVVANIDVLVAPGADQTVDTGLRRVSLGDEFGENAAVTMRVFRAPLALWLLRLFA